MKLLILLSFLISADLWAQVPDKNFYFLGSAENGDEMYVSKKPTKEKPGIKRAWVKTNYHADIDLTNALNRLKVGSRLRYHEDSLLAATTQQTNLTYYECDCKERRWRDLQYALYFWDGHTESHSNLKFDWTFVVPGTTGEVWLNYICSH
jgi:hypothetical protein